MKVNTQFLNNYNKTEVIILNYAERIKALREDNDLTQKELCKILNKSQQGYSHLENGKAKFTVDDVITLCKYFNVSADYILCLTNEPKELPNK